MEFGLWVEPEMVNLDSDLARAHPDWVLGAGRGRGAAAVARTSTCSTWPTPRPTPTCSSALDALVGEYGIDYLKWDHNRDLHEAVRTDAAGTDRPAVHAQTLAVYRLLDELRARHPRPGDRVVRSSGGARIDLGILERTDRVWASDCNDAARAQPSSAGPACCCRPSWSARTSARRARTPPHRDLDLSLRMLAALVRPRRPRVGHHDLHARRSSTALRGLGRAVPRAAAAAAQRRRGARRPPRRRRCCHGVVSPDGADAVFTVVSPVTGRGVTPGTVPLPGLDPERRYRVRVRPEAGLPATTSVAPPPWWEAAVGEGVVVAGAALGTVGLALPVLAPAQGFLLHLEAATG